jgi:hypothetical protein
MKLNGKEDIETITNALGDICSLNRLILDLQ